MPEHLTRQARLDSFLGGPIATFLKHNGFTKAHRTFRCVAPNHDTLVISFNLDNSGQNPDGQLVFLAEAAVIPPLFFDFTCDHLGITTPPQKPGTMYGMWRKRIRPSPIPADSSGKLLWPYEAWRFLSASEEDECRAGVLEGLESTLDFMMRLLNHSFWLSLVDEWREEVDYPSLWGPRAQTILLLPEGPSTELLQALRAAEAMGDFDTVDWAVGRLKSSGHSITDYAEIRRQRTLTE